MTEITPSERFISGGKYSDLSLIDLIVANGQETREEATARVGSMTLLGKLSELCAQIEKCNAAEEALDEPTAND